jgi:hypothetical protein
MYTSLKFSKKLKEAGFEKYSKWSWKDEKYLGYKLTDEYVSHDEDGFNDYYSYDILNDLCVKYAAKIFGEAWKFVDTHNILMMLQDGYTQEEVELYIWENSILNKENKK